MCILLTASGEASRLVTFELLELVYKKVCFETGKSRAFVQQTIKSRLLKTASDVAFCEQASPSDACFAESDAKAEAGAGVVFARLPGLQRCASPSTATAPCPHGQQFWVVAILLWC